jgi:large subunit ribosomal protein L4
VAERLTAELWTADGTLSGEVELEPSIFGIEPNMAVMHQVVTAQLAAARAGTHSTKTRGEVRGGGRKPWRQKGLGRARHGSNRSPQWIGGGVAHGPKPRSYVQRTPKKMKRLALRSALSARAAEGKIKVVEAFDVWEGPKTKQAVALLGAMGVSGKVLLLAEDHERVALMSFRNLDHVIACNAGQANTYDVLWADTVIMSRGTLDLGQSNPRGSTRAVSADNEPASSTEYPVARPDADVDGAPRAEHADAAESAPEMAASDDGGGA